MVDPVTRRLWTARILFLGLGIAILVASLLPLEDGPPGIPGPDLLLALTFAWLVRQPAVVPAASILLLFLLADLLLLRPPGLMTLLVLIASENLRRRRAQMLEYPFLLEWAVFAGSVMFILILSRIVLWLLMLDLPGLTLTLSHGIVTIAAYPLVVLIARFAFGLRKLGPARPDSA